MPPRVLPASLMARFAMTGFALLLACGQPAWAQSASPDRTAPAQPANVAPVIVDGNHLFPVRGTPSYPAQERADSVRRNIIAAARDGSIQVSDIHTVESADRTQILAGNLLLLPVFDFDGEFEGIDRRVLATTYTRKIGQAITQYRSDRSRPVLIRNTTIALAATALMALVLWLIVRLSRWATGLAQRRVERQLQTLEDKSHRLIRVEQLWAVLSGLMRAARLLVLVLLAYFYLHTVLGLFPWTRPAAQVLFDLVVDPLRSLWQGFVASIPDLVFLVVLFVVVRYIIRLARMFFRGVELGRIRLQSFDPDWALPTFKILRVLIVALAVVVAYPYIPGSDSAAFKGVSLFLGVIFSLGSSSLISNLIAGLSMTYRGAFKPGELVKIGEVVGAVDDVRLMTTRIRTAKNEIAVIPNSSILNANVVNYSALARTQGLVLHTTVGIGYDVPWREVEAMLLEAVARTEGLMAEPRPFVLQRSFGDFAVSYEVNAYCDDALRMLSLYSALHASIQDVFNEHGVEIMTPVYTQLLPGSAAETPAAAPVVRPE
ncbi:MAG TPA: mechanosensitive ion channel family protein [Luteimonas sp.]|nr:mechanosensitive ion channel family protein [Luteimonas sp.]HRO26326.1 mechanosensitive ion channel family protein [Luteimonas sp.]